MPGREVETDEELDEVSEGAEGREVDK